MKLITGELQFCFVTAYVFPPKDKLFSVIKKFFLTAT